MQSVAVTRLPDLGCARIVTKRVWHGEDGPDLTPGGSSEVVLEHSTESFTAFDFASNRTSITVRLNQLIAESLMIPLTVVMLDVFTNGLLERSPSEEDHAVETF